MSTTPRTTSRTRSSTGRRTAAPTISAVLALGLLTACGGTAEDEPAASETVTVTASPETDTASPTESPSSSPSPTESLSASPSPTESPSSSPTPTASPSTTPTTSPTPRRFRGLPPRPQQGECVDVRVRQNGRYQVYEAGTAVVRRTNTRLVVGRVAPNRGWRTRIDDRERDEVEIEFGRTPRNELDLEVELDDGRVEVQICADDD